MTLRAPFGKPTGREAAGSCGAHVRGCPRPVAGRSLRASCPALTRCCSRFAILASLDQQRRLPGHGQPLTHSLQG